MTTPPDNNVSRLAALFGGMSAVARACGVHRSLVFRWRQTTGLVPWKYNKAIRRAASQELALLVDECLSNPTCPTCGNPVDGDQVL